MRIIVDQDEVLAQFVAKILKRWNALSGKEFSRDDIVSWRMEEVLGKDTLGRSAEGLIDEWLAEPGFFEDLEPLPGAVEGFNKLRRMGHDVIVATSVPEVATHAYDGKRRWMRRLFPDWSMKNFIACSRKGLLDGHIIIDDGAHNISDWAQIKREGAIIFDAPWNSNVFHPDPEDSWREWNNGMLIRRAFDWVHILKIVDEIGKEKNLRRIRAEEGIFQ